MHETTINTVEKLLHQIWWAFRKVRLEDGISMTQARAMDDYMSPEQCQKARRADQEESWTDLTDDKIEKYNDVLTFLDTKGFRFYIPAFMRWVLRHPDSSCSANFCTIWALSPYLSLSTDAITDDACDSGHFELSNWRVEKYASLTAEQRQAIKSFLEFVTRSDPDGLGRSARVALDHYWSK